MRSAVVLLRRRYWGLEISPREERYLQRMLSLPRLPGPETAGYWHEFYLYATEVTTSGWFAAGFDEAAVAWRLWRLTFHPHYHPAPLVLLVAAIATGMGRCSVKFTAELLEALAQKKVPPGRAGGPGA